jgi:hypothetical protein
MFGAWKKAKAVSASKLVIKDMLLGFQYRPFSQPEPISDHLWTDDFFIGVFYNIVRYWTLVQLGRTPNAQELADIFGQTIHQLTESSQFAEAAVKTCSRAVRAAQPADDFTNGATAALKFISLVTGSNEFDGEEDVQDARRASAAAPGGATNSNAAGLYASLFIRAEYMRRFGSGTDPI